MGGQSVANPAEASVSWRGPVLIAGGLAILAFVIYGRTLGHDFINYDDPVYILTNPMVERGLTIEGIRWAFTSFHASNWHPLTWLSLMLDASLGGLKPPVFHFTNVLLHAAAGITLFFALRRMTGALWPPAMVAALFICHPAHVESVAWVTERKDTLSGLFWMLTLWAYARYTEKPGATRYLLVTGIFTAGLMAKPMLVTLPLVLLLLDYWPLRRALHGQGALAGMRLTAEKVPWLGLSAASSVVTVWAQQAGGSVETIERLPMAARAGNAALAYAGYLWQAIWPADLAVFYPHTGAHPPGGKVALAFAALAAVTAAAAILWRKAPYFIAGWLWFLGTLVPVIGLVQVGKQSMADRYTYIPFLGLFIAAVWGAASILDAKRLIAPRLAETGAGDSSAWQRDLLISRRAAFFAALLIIAAFSAAAYRAAGYWRDSETLFRRAIAVTGGSDIAFTNLASALIQQGRLEEAVPELEAALAFNPKHRTAFDNLVNAGVALGVQGNFREAADVFTKAVAIDPGHLNARYNLGQALLYLGDAPGAAGELEKVINARPSDLDARTLHAAAMASMGRLAEAKAQLQSVLAVNPAHKAARETLSQLESAQAPR